MMFKHTFYALAAVTLILFLAACDHMQVAAGKPEQPVTVTLLHMNDFHSQLDPYMPPEEPSQGGAARLKTLIDGIRKEKGDENVLLLFGGDAFQGTMFYNTWKGSAEVMTMNQLGFDAVCLGNHEFDSGADQLVRAIKGGPVTIAGVTYETEPAKFLVLSTNIDGAREPGFEDSSVKRAIIEKNGARYGLLGVTTETTANVSSPGENVKFLDYIASVQKQADALKAEGVNKIFLMSHSGTDVDMKMIPHLSGVDVVVGGHDHALFGDPETIRAMGLPKQAAQVVAPYPAVIKDRDGHNVLVVSAYEKGRWLGNIDVTFDGKGLVQDDAWKAAPVFVRGCTVDRSSGAPKEGDCSQQIAAFDGGMFAQVEKYREPMAIVANQPLGESAVDFAGRHAVDADVHSMGDLIAEILLNFAAKEKADAALINWGSMRADLAKGPVRYADVSTVLPFDNAVAILDLTGAELLESMDMAVSKAYGKSAGAYPHVAGMTIHYCKAEPCPNALRKGGRVTALTIAGKALEPQATYRIATHDYLTKGGDFYAIFKAACERAGNYCKNTGTLTRDMVADWFRTHSPVTPVTTKRTIAQ